MTVVPADAETFSRCIAVGGVAVFPTDTVYGLACEPESREAVAQLYLLKRRRPEKPAAVMFFSLELALAALPELGPRTREALSALLPGGVTLLLPNPRRRWPAGLRAGSDDAGPARPRLAAGARGAGRGALAGPAVERQRGGRPGRAHAVDEVPARIRAAADLVLDGGRLPGTPSTVVDLRSFERDERWTVVREGAVGAGAVAAALGRG